MRSHRFEIYFIYNICNITLTSALSPVPLHAVLKKVIVPLINQSINQLLFYKALNPSHRRLKASYTIKENTN